ncbi:MAG: hypothetical protein LBU91_06595 [Bacteroidales bacterium]|jgi:hypothetical protein|nr:hypothetical protein [Bacteroidales bacterium]
MTNYDDLEHRQGHGTAEDRLVFIPDNDMRAIERAIRNIEQAQKVLREATKSN